MRDINRSREWTEIPATNSDILRSVMGEVLQSELGMKYFPTHNIHPNYYELLRKTLYWKQVRLDYPTPKSATPGQGTLTPSGKRRGRPPKYIIEERNQQAAAAQATGQPTAVHPQQQQQQQQQQTQQHQVPQQETPTLQTNKKRKRDTMTSINDQLTQNHSHTLADSPLLDYGSTTLNRDRFQPPTPTQYYRVRIGTTDGKISRHAFPHGIPLIIYLTTDQNFVDVLEEIASTRGWAGEAVELHVQDPNSGEEYRLNSGTSLVIRSYGR
jgi:hypothetical protein